MKDRKEKVVTRNERKAIGGRTGVRSGIEVDWKVDTRWRRGHERPVRVKHVDRRTKRYVSGR